MTFDFGMFHIDPRHVGSYGKGVKRYILRNSVSNCTSGEKAGKPNRNLTTVHLFLKILKYDIKSWKHSQNRGSLGDLEKKVF